MNKLVELIQELCPNGVSFVDLGECVKAVSNIRWRENGDKAYQYIDLTSVDIDTHNIHDTQEIDKSNAPSRAQQIVCSEDVLLGTTRPLLKRFCLVPAEYDGDICSTGFCVLRADSNRVLPSWLFHLISSTDFFTYVERVQQGTSYPTITDAAVKAYRIPLPPIEVQREIVRILDNFTELTARKKQYEYYRDKLLTFYVFGGGTNRLEWKTLGESIISLSTGLNPRQFFKLNTEDAKNYYVTIREIQNGTIVFSEKTDRINDEALSLCNNRSHLEVGDVLFSGTGTIGETAIVSEVPTNWNIKEGVYAIKPKRELLNSRYLMYLLRTRYMQLAISKKVAGGTVKSIPMGDMRKLQIPVPDITVQESIVSILDRFDALCNDLTSGLPAEIAARQKQYEYYRDKLLTFKERISI